MTLASRWALPAAALTFLLLLVWSYWPGLAGPFLFDDYANLDVLGAYGHIHGLGDLLVYATSGNADPTGRPLSLLSFLLDASSWPADPRPFKRTNLLLHLLNACLLAAVIARLQLKWAGSAGNTGASRWTPLAAAGLWAAHPFLVSTTLYVVQREAMLPMTFVMLGVLAWLSAVSSFESGRLGRGWALAIVGVGGATLLGGLSKANGFLTPALVALVHLWFLRSQDSPHRQTIDRAATICLGLPTLLLMAYLAYIGWALWGEPLQGRNWTLRERLLSEPRVLWAYVWRLALPRAGAGGLFVDDFPASQAWLAPWTTLPAVVGLIAVTAAAAALRRQFPIITFAWLFYITAHLMESTVVPLELYFEHRNYLAAAMFGWPLANALLGRGSYSRYRGTTLAMLLATLLLLTHERAAVWGNGDLMGAVAAVHESDSARAQVDAARQEIQRGRVDAAIDRLHQLQRREPQSVDAAITTVGAECTGKGMLASDTLARTRHTLATSRIWNYGLYEWMQAAATSQMMLGCGGFGLGGLEALVDSAESNPQNRPALRMRDLRHVRGSIALAAGEPRRALQWYDEAISLLPDPDYALVQAAALGEAGVPALGVQHLDTYQRLEAARTPNSLGGMPGIHAWLLNRFGYYQNEIRSLRAQLQSEAASAPLQRH